MQDHPLPQNISSYQFHLIGDMTLKQFLYLAGGVAGAWIFYSLPIIVIFKWPLIALSLIIGTTFAFMPYAERSLDQWFLAFIKAIYSPTRFHWKKSPSIPEFLTTQPTIKLEPTTQTPTSITTQTLDTYLESLKATSINLDTKETQTLNIINQLFQTVQPPVSLTRQPLPQPEVVVKTVKVQVRKLKTPPPNFSSSSYSVPSKKFTAFSDQKPIPSHPSITPPTISTPTPPLVARVRPNSSKAIVNTRLPFPSTPTIPNLIVGMTLDPHRNILENTIIEIKDASGHSVRALKSNKLGQFYIATPLPSGTYEINAEKDGYYFDAINIKIEGKITPPIEITAKSSPPHLN